MTTPEERLETAREEGRRKLAEAPRAGIYCRMSLASMGDTTKIDDQERICREMAERRGWDVAEVYTDNSLSAWQLDRDGNVRKRPGWDRMLADVESGRITAIVTYHGDRLIRRHEDLSALIKLSRSKGIQLASPTGTRNLDSYDDQFILEIEASMAKRESANISRRKKAQHERMRRAGLTRPGGRGGRAFGFATDGVTHVEEETAVVREVAERILAGEGIRTIATSLAARGVTTTAGTPMHPIAIRRMIASPRYAGLMPDGEQAAAWKPVLPREEWEAARDITKARSGPLPAGHTARRYLLSGIARCGECGSGLQALTAYTTKGGAYIPAAYACKQTGCGKVRRSLPLLDAYVARRTVNRLAHPANPPGEVLTGSGIAAEFTVLAAERAAAEEQVRDYRTSPGRVGLLMQRLDSIDARLAELRELASDDTRTRIMTAHAGITAEAFAGLPLATRRALISACYEVVVLPASKRGPGFRREDVSLAPR